MRSEWISSLIELEYTRRADDYRQYKVTSEEDTIRRDIQARLKALKIKPKNLRLTLHAGSYYVGSYARTYPGYCLKVSYNVPPTKKGEWYGQNVNVTITIVRNPHGLHVDKNVNVWNANRDEDNPSRNLFNGLVAEIKTAAGLPLNDQDRKDIAKWETE